MNIVLLHGVLGFGAITPPLPQYFNGVAAHLKTVFNANVLSPSVAPIGQIPTRAAQAAKQIADALAQGILNPAERIHLIAHSMGGLDARELIFKDREGLQSRIATLVCIGTPHLGSPVASLLDSLNPFNQFINVVVPHAPILERLRQQTDAVKDLSELSAATFNHACPDVPSVRYLNIAGIGRRQGRHTALFFEPTFLFVALRSPGQNDGVVPFASATHAAQPFDVWEADHADLIGHDLDQPISAPRPDHLARYENLVRQF